MKKLIKIYLIMFIFTLGILSSCGPSRYYSYRSYVKHRSHNYVRSSYGGGAYRSSYQRKIKHNTLPINKNYIIRSKQRPSNWR